MNIQRLPKGHRVVCAFLFDWKSIVKDNKSSYTEDNEKIFVECFVSGDEPGSGLSVVALDNPEWCIYQNRGDAINKRYSPTQEPTCKNYSVVAVKNHWHSLPAYRTV